MKRISGLVMMAVGLCLSCGAPMKSLATGDDPIGYDPIPGNRIPSGCEPLENGPALPDYKPPQSDGEPFDVVVYTAHPDDESMYVGGTLSRLRDEGRKTAVVVLSHGEGGRLLEPDANGNLIERRDRPRARVAAIRDREMARAAQIGGFALGYLYSAGSNSDYAFNTSCTDTMAHWQQNLQGGVSGILSRLVDDIRARRPRVIVTMDPRDDPGGSQHGHHKAMGVLVELAARLAADPGLDSGSPHHVQELWTFAPKGQPHTLEIKVDPAARLAMLKAHSSQFLAKHLTGFGARPKEHFVLRWRAKNTPEDSGGTLLEKMLLSDLADDPEPISTMIEILPVVLKKGQVYLWTPESGSSWRISYVAQAHPHQTVSNAAGDANLEPILIHSTSWRHQKDGLILTYLVVLKSSAEAPEGFGSIAFKSGAILRGGATLPPDQIGISAVLNHALEHLSWLLREDPAVQNVLNAQWRKVLDPYIPKPFLSEPAKGRSKD